jgi:Cu/Ag efflux protein CusF
MTKHVRALAFLTALAFACSALTLLAAQTKQPPKGAKEFVFKGKVEAIDVKNKTMTVNGENVQGWMAAMTMSYKTDKEDAITRVKVGDQITAKVYEGDVMTLYDVQVVPPKDGKAPAKK